MFCRAGFCSLFAEQDASRASRSGPPPAAPAIVGKSGVTPGFQEPIGLTTTDPGDAHDHGVVGIY